MFKRLFRTAIAVSVSSMMLTACSDSTDTTKVEDPQDVLANAPFTLQLLHFADVDGNEETALASVDEFSGLVDAFKKDAIYGKNSLLVSSGDHIIQGPRFYAAERIKATTGSDEPGSADIALMNAMGVQAATIGNHELDAGPGEFAEAINKDIKATFPHLSANIDFSNDDDFTPGSDGDNIANMSGLVARYAVATIDNQSVGIVGAATPTLPTITSTGSLQVTPAPTASVSDLAAAIQPAVNALKAKGINKIILLSHMQQIQIEKELATKLDGVDIIVAGGSNTRMGDSNDDLYPGDGAFSETYPFKATGMDGNPTLVVNVDGDYKYLGRLVVGFDANGAILENSLSDSLNGSYASTAAMVSEYSGTINGTVVAIRDAVQGVITAQYGNIVGYTNVYLDGRRSQVRTQETNLGNLTADANLWYANTLSNVGPIHVSLKNGGGIRTEIGSAILPAGSTNEADIVYSAPDNNGISEGHLRATLRFDNGLVLLKVTPAELKDLLEHSLAATADGATPGQFPQIAGMKITYNTSYTARTAQGNGERIRELEILNADGTVMEDVVTNGAINPNLSASYRLVTLNFLANGGDSYPFDLLTDAARLNLYEGTGYGEEIDYDDADLTKDPGKNTTFSYTGGEQDALAEYLQMYHPAVGSAYNSAETAQGADTRIVKQ